MIVDAMPHAMDVGPPVPEEKFPGTLVGMDMNKMTSP